MIIGLDMGGTHVDGVLIEEGKIVDSIKIPTNSSDLFSSIWLVLKKLFSNKDMSKLERINLSTTISTNSIIENKTDKVAMFIEGGPGIDPANFNCGDSMIFLDGYIDHRGREIKPFNKNLLIKEIDHISSKGIKAAAVVTKFSTRNPSHELMIRDFLTDKNFLPITTGHTLSGKLNFPRRIYTSYLNSAIYNSFNKFEIAIKKALKEEGLNIPLYILKADGGTMNLSEASKFPVQTILSGPAASVMGGLACSNFKGDALLLDIGGTTTDISFLADGVPLFVPEGITISGYPTLVRSIYNFSIGLGGDSELKFDNGGNILIGPNRKGSPMALDGPIPTPSDAMIVLDKLNFGDKNKALDAMYILGKKMNVSPIIAAEKVYNRFASIIKARVSKILSEINERPVYTIKELLYGKELSPEKIIAIGGPAKAMSSGLRKAFNLPCEVPINYSIANAIGAALARRTFEITLLADTERGILSVPEMEIYKEISRNYNLNQGKEDAIKLLTLRISQLEDKEYSDTIQITEESSFNMVRGFYTSGRNIRVKAQVIPGITSKIGGIDNAKGK